MDRTCPNCGEPLSNRDAITYGRCEDCAATTMDKVWSSRLSQEEGRLALKLEVALALRKELRRGRIPN